MSIQNPLENYGLERIRMEEDDRYVWVYYAGKVENVVNKLTKENEELKTKLEDVQATAYAESVDAGMENRKLKRALWLARAKNASYNVKDRQRIINRELDQERPDIEFIPHHEKVKQKWMNVKSICKKKAEEYK